MENKGSRKRGVKFYLLLVLAVMGAALITAGVVWAVTAVLEKRAINKQMSPDAMVSYMNEKYNTVFTFKERAGANIIQGIPRRQIIVTCEEFPGENISVSVDRTEDNKFIYRDNYVSYLIRDEMQAKLEEIVKEVYGEGCKIISKFGDGVLPENFNANTTFEEYTENRHGDWGVWMFLPESADVTIKEEKSLEIVRLLKEKKIYASYKICYLKSNNYFKEINKKNYYDIVSKQDMYKAFGHFALYENYEFIYNDWEEVK